MINMARFYNIKFLHEVEGLSQRQLAKKLGISRNTVKIIYRQRRLQQQFNDKRSIVIPKSIQMKLNGNALDLIPASETTLTFHNDSFLPTNSTTFRYSQHTYKSSLNM
ncbi:Homeodomain-like domain-containing protein [Bacillus sp. OV194]|nr:Homeodomain-like domain-containing protein [Bacillus sp. OV194]